MLASPMLRPARNVRATATQQSPYIICAAAVAAICCVASTAGKPDAAVRFVVTADAHYGISRPAFRGGTNVGAQTVNRALVSAMNRLGVPVDFVAEAGDIANRQEGVGADAIQSASTSWGQFEHDYIEGVTLRDRAGRRTPILVVPGNHESSNAVGFYQPMTPSIDTGPMVAIFNLMMRPKTVRTLGTFDYARDRIWYSRDYGGVHFVFVSLWPDSAARRWLEADLARVAPTMPVLLVTHDQPDVEAKHLRNPNGRHDINDVDRFENLLSDTLADGQTIDTPTVIEQRALESFLHRHANILGYFHGNSNWNQFYDWNGPDGTIGLHVFRVDSPMKGKASLSDERRLSFQVATIDPARRELTVREYLWNTATWGDQVTVALKVSSRP